MTITSPTNGDIIFRPDVQVTGSITHADGLETGVTVNGIVALVHGGQFVANHVPLQVGENTITILALDINGEQVGEILSLNIEPSTRYIELESDIKSGLAPLEAVLRLDSNFIISGQATVSPTGPGEVTFQDVSEPHTWNVTMTEPGIYVFIIEQTGSGLTIGCFLDKSNGGQK